MKVTKFLFLLMQYRTFKNVFTSYVFTSFIKLTIFYEIIILLPLIPSITIKFILGGNKGQIGVATVVNKRLGHRVKYYIQHSVIQIKEQTKPKTTIIVKEPR